MPFLNINKNKEVAKVDKKNTTFHNSRAQMPKLTDIPPPTEDELSKLTEEFDFSSFPPKIALFAKHYILNGGNASKAIVDSQLYGGKSDSGMRVMASKYLRKLRSHPEFWDFLGLGYGDLKEVVDNLKLTDPKAAAAIIMKVNKEDVEQIEHSGSITIAFEKDLD